MSRLGPQVAVWQKAGVANSSAVGLPLVSAFHRCERATRPCSFSSCSWESSIINMNVMVLRSWPDMESKLLEGINDRITHLRNDAI